MIFLVHRLVELADFYELEGYQYWGRMHQTEPTFGSDSESSDSSDYASNLTRAEAVRLFPDAAHQALAATLGLVYYKIRNEVGEGPNARLPTRPPKRQQEEVASTNSGSKHKQVKVARRPNEMSPTTLQKLVTGTSWESKSIVSEESDKLGWNAHSETSDEAMSKLRGLVSEEVGTILRALERGRAKLKPGRNERTNLSPTESKGGSRRGKLGLDGAQDDEESTLPNTVPTEIVSPSSGRTEKTEEHELPATASNSPSP